MLRVPYTATSEPSRITLPEVMAERLTDSKATFVVVLGAGFPVFVWNGAKSISVSIFMMYNLFADVDPEQPNNIILRHRDEYYDNGTEKDWTYKLAKDREQNLEFLPDVSSKRLILTYKQDTDEPNVLFFQSTDEIYGQQEYIFDSEYVRDVDTKELIFSPTPIAQTPFGAIVPMINGQTPKTNIRILYDGGEQPCGVWNLVANGVVGTFGIDTYPATPPVTPFAMFCCDAFTNAEIAIAVSIPICTNADALFRFSSFFWSLVINVLKLTTLCA